jgi:hypothetical protein
MKKVDAKKVYNKKPGSGKFNKNNKKNSNSKYAWLYETPKLGQGHQRHQMALVSSSRQGQQMGKAYLGQLQGQKGEGRRKG